MKPNEQIQKTFDLMQRDMSDKWFICMVAYYVRPKWVDIDKIAEEQSMWWSCSKATHYDYVTFQKYLNDNLFNTYLE
jgi:hypothetical protein